MENNNISIIDEKQRRIESYDQFVKYIFSNRYVIANYLQAFVEEYKNMSIDKIKDYIVDSHNTIFIDGINSEDNNVLNGQIKYDFIFVCESPVDNKKIYVNLELEGQISSNYRLESRSKYYAYRMLDRQKQVDFEKQNFDDLCKVYSIWTILKPKNDEQNSIKYYYEDSKYLLKDKEKTDKKDINYLNIIHLNLGKNNDYTSKSIMHLTYLLFKDTSIDDNERERILYEDYGIIGLRKEVLKTMCHVTEVFEYNGRLEGKLEGTVDTIINFIQRAKMPLDEAIYNSGIDDSIKEEVIKQVKLKLSK